ncbi:unnamed protein product [Rotaria sp. Silwood2]|nr:unnamed protein product [Rotaria sp. Silwood2]CAF3073750.1 unnamed protein product [Rotaria sp. Silwood2]CAF3374399.1 unnamed protein product [Rotaria sp. Silwood2]CAF4482723.1 unnamed protein product [Rotaria sp. Silwood2]CAF4566026.1 unnamed protein product [Rotaria sp. Silwood2]
MFNNNSSSQRSSLQSNDSRRDSTTGSSRILSPIAFFHDGITINDVDLRYNITGIQRRAQAIATAPRRNRYDDDDNDEDNAKKKIFFGFVNTIAVPIPTPSVPQQTQSLPKIQSDTNLMPNFRVNPTIRYESSEFDYLYGNNSQRNRFSSESLP